MVENVKGIIGLNVYNIVTILDDKAYTLAMAAYFLSELRRQNITKKSRPTFDNLVDSLPIRQAKRNKLF